MAQPILKDTPTLAGNTSCDHCGEDCPTTEIALEGKVFCCEGCKMVYEILNQNDLCTYYNLNKNPGITVKGKKDSSRFAFLDDADIQRSLVNFENDELVKVTFKIPQMHCSACIWLLENLYKLNEAVTQSKVNFLKKELYLTFFKNETTLREVVNLLSTIGYEPEINLNDLDQSPTIKPNRRFAYQIGIAGFCFGNIMLASFPEYLGLNKALEGEFFKFFGYLNLGMVLPVVFFSAADYFKSAVAGIRQKNLNIDVPIALGISTLFLRSAYEILTHTGAGYLDSLAGLVFFLLVGRWFQRKTYDTISFERDYKSYFPISATLKKGNSTESVALNKLSEGDIIIVKNQELIPADGLLLKGRANIDYSFVTGEAEPLRKTTGEVLYAGGRQVGDAITVQLTKEVSQSYLTQLWNSEAFEKDANKSISVLADKIGKYFTIAILIIAAITGVFWLLTDASVAINAFTAVLIIACPCAVALSIPFTLGNALRVFGRHHFYLKNTGVIESIPSISAIVFDKTGTLTNVKEMEVAYHGISLSDVQKAQILTVAAQSSHPKSKGIVDFFKSMKPLTDIRDFKEKVGSGTVGKVGEVVVKIGSGEFLGLKNADYGTYVSIDDEVLGYFTFNHKFRTGLEDVMDELSAVHHLSLLSGDNDSEAERFSIFFKNKNALKFFQTPKDKLTYINELQQQGEKVIMLGDGLNDAGALQQSDIGIAVSENVNQFSPACDAILDAQSFTKFSKFLQFGAGSLRMVRFAFILSFLYNTVGLYFAVQGLLSPVIAAILMPLSSISVVIWGIVSTNVLAKRLGL